MNPHAYWRRPFRHPDALTLHVVNTTRDACDPEAAPRRAVRIDRICWTVAVMLLLFVAWAALAHPSP